MLIERMRLDLASGGGGGCGRRGVADEAATDGGDEDGEGDVV